MKKHLSGPTIEKARDLAGLLTKPLRKVTCFSSMKSIGSKSPSRNISPIRRWRISSWISSSTRGRTRAECAAESAALHVDWRGDVSAAAYAHTAPLLTRFPIRERLDYYHSEQLEKIVIRSARLLAIEIEERGAAEIARRSRGTPRIANNLLRRVRDFAQVKGEGRITAAIADKALAMLEIDENGLDEMDKRILETIIVEICRRPGRESVRWQWRWVKSQIRWKRFMSRISSWKDTFNARRRAVVGYGVGIQETRAETCRRKSVPAFVR